MLDYGEGVPAQVDSINTQRTAALAACAEMFNRCSVVLTPAVEGEAPRGLGSTGDSRLGGLWALLGLPAVCIPAAAGFTGMPVGVQLVGPAGNDAELRAATDLADRRQAGTRDRTRGRILPGSPRLTAALPAFRVGGPMDLAITDG